MMNMVNTVNKVTCVARTAHVYSETLISWHGCSSCPFASRGVIVPLSWMQKT